MLKLNSIMIGSMQPKVLAEFYEKVFGRPADMLEEGWWGWNFDGMFFSVGEHSEMGGMTKDPGRLIFNLESRETQQEYERIKNSGAKVVKELYEMQGAHIATFADPDGNYFQIMSPWESAK